MAKEYSTIDTQIGVIKNETVENANTTTRVGTTLQDITDKVEDNDNVKILTFTTDRPTTRLLVTENRKKGLELRYGGFREYYIGTELDDIAWSLESNWEQLIDKDYVDDKNAQLSSDLNSKIADIESNLVQKSENTVTAIIGTNYSNIIERNIPANTPFYIKTIGTSKLNNYFITINGATYSSCTGDQTINITLNYRVTTINLNRVGESVLANGDITMIVGLSDSIPDKTVELENDVVVVENDIAVLNNNIADIENNIKTITTLQPDITLGKYYNYNSVIPVVFTGKYTANSINISAYIGNKLRIAFGTIGATSVRSCIITDQNDNVLAYSIESQMTLVGNEYIKDIEIPSGASKLYISFSPEIVSYSFKIINIIFDLTGEKELVYVDAITGSDENSGSNVAPFKTFAKALNSTGKNTTIIFSGETNEQINVKTKSNQASIRIVGKYGNKNRIMRGTKIINPTLVENNVYQALVTSFSSLANYVIFQHEVDDVNTLIADSDRLPQQRGKEYRCEHTQLTRNTSLNDVKNASGYTYYYDSDNSILYFKAANADFLNHPIVMPVDSESGIYGNDGTVHVEITNIEFVYCMGNFDYCPGAIIKDCKAGYGCTTGGFRYNLSVGIQFICCESARVNNGTSNGDGFNAHAEIDITQFGNAPVFSKHISASLTDCWSHDNNDDGYSDHERSETVIRGGLFEFNGKAGITPAYGSHCSCYNVISRNNFSGFYYVGSVSDVTPSEGGKYGQLLCIGCISENNTRGTTGFGFGVQGDNNKAILKDCISIGNTVGFKCNDNTNAMILYNCRSLNDITIKSTTGMFIINNSDLVD